MLLVFGLLEKCQHFDYSITNGRMTVFGTLLFSQSEEMSPLDLAKPCFVFLLQFYFILFLELFSLLYVLYFFSSCNKQKIVIMINEYSNQMSSCKHFDVLKILYTCTIKTIHASDHKSNVQR